MDTKPVVAPQTKTVRALISRRAAIAGALAPTMSIAEAAAADPIFPVLEKFQLAQQALSKALKAADLPRGEWLTPAYVEAQTELKNTYASFRKAQLSLLTTMPTTRAGLAALLDRLGQATHVPVTSGNIEPALLAEAMCWGDEQNRRAADTVLNRLAALVLKIA